MPMSERKGNEIRQKKKQIVELTLNQVIYLAGIVDGEGALMITRKRMKNYKSTIYPHEEYFALIPIIQISNTNNDLIDILLSWGFHETGSQQRPKGKLVRVVIVSRLNDLKKLLEWIQPFLIVKKEQAKILKAFVDSRLQKYWSYGCRRKYTLEEIQYRNSIKILNLRGKHDASIS